jgi:hypothetical protein
MTIWEQKIEKLEKFIADLWSSLNYEQNNNYVYKTIGQYVCWMLEGNNFNDYSLEEEISIAEFRWRYDNVFLTHKNKKWKSDYRSFLQKGANLYPIVMD